MDLMPLAARPRKYAQASERLRQRACESGVQICESHWVPGSIPQVTYMESVL